ncbi:MAG: SGNH/GDSL hydrolase family protein [Tetrasphaera sp.]
MSPPRVSQPRVWERYVAIGDSFTEGMVDPDPTGATEFAGWADRLAAHLSSYAAAAGRPFAYANLAVRGRKLDDVVGPQLAAAVELGPDLVSVVGGGNDILRPSVDIDALADRLEEAVIRLRGNGIDVLLATPTDPRDSGLFKALRARHAIHTANLFTIAQRHGAHVLNLWGIGSVQDWRMWGEDRIHLTSEGHRRVANAALVALGLPPADPEWDVPLPAAPAQTRVAQLRGHLAWARTYAGPWVQRRVRRTSSGAALAAKRPALLGLESPGECDGRHDDTPPDVLA